MKGLNLPNHQSLMFLPFLDQFRGVPLGASSPGLLTGQTPVPSLPTTSPSVSTPERMFGKQTHFRAQIFIQPRRTHFQIMGHIPSPWMKYGAPNSMNSQSPSPPAAPPPAADPDTPLNLSKPKSDSPSSHHSGNSPSAAAAAAAAARWSDSLQLAANNAELSAKMLSHSAMMGRPPFLPYSNLPHPASGAYFRSRGLR